MLFKLKNLPILSFTVIQISFIIFVLIVENKALFGSKVKG